MSTMETS